ncbi:hypothetical protein AB1L42_22005 [Thalassoglobus sp. JC818]|uniref:hypothetical protein n=1 Tax=Thalassoglobus sp. JC818 TaxID=3232136 RepID=UPI00345881F6
MTFLLETYFQWPVLPFSILLVVVTLYWLLVIAGGIDIDVFDFDLGFDMDLDPDVSPSATDLGMLGLRWLNLGEVPFMVWLSIVAIVSWISTMLLDRGLEDPTLGESAFAIARSLGLGIVGAKLITNPLRGRLRIKQPNTLSDLLGKTCTIVTTEANSEFGQAMCAVDNGAPLRLNVRTVEGSAAKDSLVRIVDYSPETGIYYVECTEDA